MVLSMNKEESDNFIFKLVYIDWIDTVSSADWDTKDNVNTKIVKQVGWVVHNDAKVMKIASTYSEEEYYSITAIPTGCILSVKSVI
jgi:hypothetical protein